jgi:phage internal scaffolding protein
MSFYKYNTDGTVIRNRHGLDCQQAIEDGEEVRVEQHHKDEVNVNNIVRKHGMELITKVAALQEFTYDDVVGNDFQESMNILLKAADAFESVPSDIRKQFDNDPAKFLDFVHNPDNKDQMITWGLMEAPVEQKPIEVVVTNPPPVETPPEV